MGKLSNLFVQVRKTRSSKGIGFVGKNSIANKPRAAALLVELNTLNASNAEAAIKAGANGLIFPWRGINSSSTDVENLKKAITAAQKAGEDLVFGLHITNDTKDWNKQTRKDFENLHENGVGFVIFPLEAPARLLALHIKDLELVVSVPMRSGDLYPVFIRNLSAFEHIAAIDLDFGLSNEVGSMSIEDVLHYRAVREAVRAPALVHVQGTPDEDDAYALLMLGIQVVVLVENKQAAVAEQQIQALGALLEKIQFEDKDEPKLGLTVK